MTKSFGIYTYLSVATLKGSHSKYIHTNILYRDTKFSSQLMNVSWVH